MEIESHWVVYKSYKNIPNLSMTSLSASKLKNSYSQTDYENLIFELADRKWRHTQVRGIFVAYIYYSTEYKI